MPYLRSCKVDGEAIGLQPCLTLRKWNTELLVLSVLPFQSCWHQLLGGIWVLVCEVQVGSSFAQQCFPIRRAG